MNLKPGDIVSIKHYSEMQPIKSVITQADESIISLKLTKEFAIHNFFEGDPIVLGLEQDNEVYISECTIDSISTKNSTITISYGEMELLTNRRLSERFPVSLYAEIRSSNFRKRIVANVKNISLTGISIISKQDFPEGEVVQLDLYLDNKVVFFEGEIIWKTQRHDKFEYGLKIIFTDMSAKNSLKTYLVILKDEQEDAIRNLMNE